MTSSSRTPNFGSSARLLPARLAAAAAEADESTKAPRTIDVRAVQVSPPKPRPWQLPAKEGCADEGAGRQPPAAVLDAESVHQMVRSAASKVLSAHGGLEVPMPEEDLRESALKQRSTSRSGWGAFEGGPIVIPHNAPSAAPATAKSITTANHNAILVEELRRELAARDVEVAQLRTQVSEKCSALETLREEHARGRAEQTAELQSLKERMSKLEQMLLEAAMAKQAEVLPGVSQLRSQLHDQCQGAARSEASADASEATRQPPLMSTYGSPCMLEPFRCRRESSADPGASPSARAPLRFSPAAASGSFRAMAGRAERTCPPPPPSAPDESQQIRRSLQARSFGSSSTPSLRWQLASRSTSPAGRRSFGLTPASARLPSSPRRLPMGVALMPPPVLQRRIVP